MTAEELKARYGKSENGNFWVSETICVPHPFCIGPRHVEIAADRFGGILNEASLDAAEQEGYGCQMRDGPHGHDKCQLPLAEHQTALLVHCKTDMKGSNGRADPELHTYLLACKAKAEEDKMAGFAFMRVS